MKVFLRSILIITYLCCLMSMANAEQADPQMNPELQQLADDFFSWRAVQQPATLDDIPRVERPTGWLPDYSTSALASQRARYADFLTELERLDKTGWSITDQVDARLLRAAIHRIRWELVVLRHPHRNPLFYVDQTLGSVFELLILSTPIDRQRAGEYLLRLEYFPITIAVAKKNLTEGVQPFADATIATLDGVEQKLEQMHAALARQFPADLKQRLDHAIHSASAAMLDYRGWLQQHRAGMSKEFSLGAHAYQYFLSQVALIPHTPDELLHMGRQAWNRSVTFDVLEKNRNAGLPELEIFPDAEAQIAAEQKMEQEIRDFLEQHNLMTVPDWLGHYHNRLRPDHLIPLAFMGVNDDLTSETRLNEDAISYIPPPAENLSYFALSSAKDPRPIIIHEGVPGHYFQMALSWANPNPVRRRYIDSGANEGIGFYVEEMMLQAGLFDESPRSREIIYSFMRLRALRVEVDIRLATGDFDIEQAGAYLARTVPMDEATAREEAVFFAFNPGQAITYQIGALQIQQFLTDARLDKGDDFSLRRFHDYLMQNGNVPIALLRWEYLGQDDEIKRLDSLRRQSGG